MQLEFLVAQNLVDFHRSDFSGVDISRPLTRHFATTATTAAAAAATTTTAVAAAVVGGPMTRRRAATKLTPSAVVAANHNHSPQPLQIRNVPIAQMFRKLRPHVNSVADFHNVVRLLAGTLDLYPDLNAEGSKVSPSSRRQRRVMEQDTTIPLAIRRIVCGTLQNCKVQAKFVLRKFAAIVLPFMGPSKRSFITEKLHLVDIPYEEGNWSRTNCIDILRAVCVHAPQYARIPINLRTRLPPSSATAATAPTGSASTTSIDSFAPFSDTFDSSVDDAATEEQEQGQGPLSGPAAVAHVFPTPTIAPSVPTITTTTTKATDSLGPTNVFNKTLPTFYPSAVTPFFPFPTQHCGLRGFPGWALHPFSHFTQHSTHPVDVPQKWGVTSIDEGPKPPIVYSFPHNMANVSLNMHSMHTMSFPWGVKYFSK